MRASPKLHEVAGSGVGLGVNRYLRYRVFGRNYSAIIYVFHGKLRLICGDV